MVNRILCIIVALIILCSPVFGQRIKKVELSKEADLIVCFVPVEQILQANIFVWWAQEEINWYESGNFNRGWWYEVEGESADSLSLKIYVVPQNQCHLANVKAYEVKSPDLARYPAQYGRRTLMAYVYQNTY